MKFRLFVENLEQIAKKKVLAPIGDPTFHPNEKVVKTIPIKVKNAGIDEDMFVLITTSEINGLRLNGRLLLTFDANDKNFFEGTFRHIEPRKDITDSILLNWRTL